MILPSAAPSAFACGVLALGALVLSGCGDKGTPAPARNEAATSTPAPASTANKVAETASKTTAAAQDAAAKTAEAAKTAADKAKTATTEAANKVTDTAKAGVEKTGEAGKVTLDAVAGKSEATRAPAPQPTPTPAKAQTPQEQADARVLAQKAEMDAKAKLAATKLDPMQQDVDPNSKARLTYEFGTDTKLFGKVMQGDVLNHKFQLQSSGEEDLVIKQAKPTCGCTVANILVEENGKLEPYQYGKPIAPNRKLEIDATLHTQNKRGHASSKINIMTNDPRGQTILSLEAEVEPFFQYNPQSVNFAQMGAKDTATDKVLISTTKGDRVKLSAVKDNMPQGLKIDLNPLDADPEGKATRYEMVVTAGPGLVEGNLAYSVPLRSDAPIPGGERMPNGQMPTYEVAVTVMARVTGAISFNPAFVSLGLIRPAQTLARTVRITSHDPAFKLDPKVSIQGRDTVEWEFAKNFTSVVRPVTGENAVDVEVTLTGMPESLSGSFSGMLVVTIGHPEKPEIKLPITGVCRGGAGAPAPTPVPVPAPVPVGGGNPPK